MAKVYEHIFKYGKYGKNICIREYDTDTKQVTFNTNIATNEFIPTLYSPKPKSGFKKSSMVTFEDDSPLWEKNFEKMGDLTKIINPEKRTDEEKELLEIQEEVGLTEAQEERLNFLRKMRSEANKKIQDEYYGNPDRVQQVIREKYPDAVKYDHDFHTIFIDIETRSGVNSNRFPEAEHALEEVTVIQMYCTKRKQFYIFGTKDWTGAYNSLFGKINYIKFRNEKDLLRGFVEFISNDYPASLFGFNCIPLTSNVWGKDSIVEIQNLKYKDTIANDVKVTNIFPISKKEMYEIQTTAYNIQSSNDHIFKIFSKPKSSYFNPSVSISNTKLIEQDLAVKDIDLNRDNYLQQPIHKNKNKSQTYRDVIYNNIELLHKKGFKFLCRDEYIVRKMTSELGYGTWDKKYHFFSSDYVMDILGKTEVLNYLNRVDKIYILHNGAKNNNKNITKVCLILDNVINFDICWLLGIWYTDGTQSYKWELSIRNTNKSIIDKASKLFSTTPKKLKKQSSKHSQQYITSTGIGTNGELLLLKTLIYDSIYYSKKSIDLHLLSQLSESQFCAFYAGLVDGDGYKDGRFCNFNNDIEKISELVKWNSGFSIVSNNILTPFFKDNVLNKIKNNSVYTDRSENIRCIDDLYFVHKQQCRKNWYSKDDDCVYVIITDIVKTNKYVDMLDIETSTHYFQYKGVTTHNCQAFDYPYIVNRIANNYQDIEYKKLSPVGEVTLNVKKKTFDDREFLGVDINGIFLLDQRDLVLKYAFLSLANYGLQDVAFAYGLKGKSSQESYEYQSFDGNYTGEGWVKLISDVDRVPDDEKLVWKLQDAKQKCMRTAPEKWTPELQKRLEQAVYNTFMDYSIRDVELMLEIEEQSKLIGIAKWIAYTCGVNITDVMGTYKQWHSYTFNDAIKDGRVLPLTQKNGDDEAVYKAGFVTAFPGIYKYVLSVDFASLFPNVFQAVNIGADTIIPEDKMPEDLLEIREKYFHFFTNENFYDTAQRKTESDAHHEERIKGKKDGKLIAKYGSDGCNDLQEERDYYAWLLNQDFSETLRKHNVSVSPNGYFYSHHKQSYTSRAMENGIKKRYEAKYKGIKLAGVVEDIKKVQAQRKEGKHPELFKDVSDEKLQSILETTIKEMEYEDSLSLALKIFINSNYGSQAMSMNAFSNGRLTGASVTITARLLIQTVANALSNEIRRFLGEEPTFDLSEIVQMDTDSAYLCLDRLIEAKLPNDTEAQILQFIQNLFKSKLAPVIQNTIDDIGNRLNFMKPEVLKMDQEIVSNSFVSLALKRYFARVIMSDGNVLATPKIKMTGISLVSRSTPDEVKLILKPTLDYFLNNDQEGLNKYLNDHFQDFKNIDPSRLSRPQSVASLDYKPYYDKREVKDWKIANKFARPMRDKKKSIAEGRKVMKLQTAPLNSKASIVHNHLVLEAGLEGKYELIRNADKIRIVYLKTPNPVTNNIDAIAYKDSQALKDLGVLPYVDFQTIWDKELIKKVDIIAEKVGWKIGVRTATTERADEPW